MDLAAFYADSDSMKAISNSQMEAATDKAQSLQQCSALQAPESNAAAPAAARPPSSHPSQSPPPSWNARHVPIADGTIRIIDQPANQSIQGQFIIQQQVGQHTHPYYSYNGTPFPCQAGTMSPLPQPLAQSVTHQPLLQSQQTAVNYSVNQSSSQKALQEVNDANCDARDVPPAAAGQSTAEQDVLDDEYTVAIDSSFVEKESSNTDNDQEDKLMELQDLNYVTANESRDVLPPAAAGQSTAVQDDDMYTETIDSSFVEKESSNTDSEPKDQSIELQDVNDDDPAAAEKTNAVQDEAKYTLAIDPSAEKERINTDSEPRDQLTEPQDVNDDVNDVTGREAQNVHPATTADGQTTVVQYVLDAKYTETIDSSVEKKEMSNTDSEPRHQMKELQAVNSVTNSEALNAHPVAASGQPIDAKITETIDSFIEKESSNTDSEPIDQLMELQAVNSVTTSEARDVRPAVTANQTIEVQETALDVEYTAAIDSSDERERIDPIDQDTAGEATAEDAEYTQTIDSFVEKERHNTDSERRDQSIELQAGNDITDSEARDLNHAAAAAVAVVQTAVQKTSSDAENTEAIISFVEEERSNTGSEQTVVKESNADSKNCIAANEPTERYSYVSSAEEVESITGNNAIKDPSLWTCSKCSYNVNPSSKEKCSYCSADRIAGLNHSMDVQQSADSCKESKGSGTNDAGTDQMSGKSNKSPKKRQRIEEILLFGSSSDSDCDDGNIVMVDEETKPWHCGRCSNYNTKSKFKCSNCHGWRGGKKPTKNNKKWSEHMDSDEGSDAEPASQEGWVCTKCDYFNTKSKFKCSSCLGWRDGKRPTKNNKWGDDADSDEELVSQEGWACAKCDYFNARNSGNCAGCFRLKSNRVRHSPEITYEEDSSEEDEETYSEYEEDADEKEKHTAWTCLKCTLVNSVTSARCSGCRAWKGGKMAPKKNKTANIGWTCIKCTHLNTKSLTKCSDCGGWKDGKRPVKKPIAEKPIELPLTQYKPLFEKGEPVYAPWWPPNRKNSERSWHPGVIKDYVTLKNGPYGPVRRYAIQFDDGDELDDIDDYLIFSREDYLLSGKQDWIGVVNKSDKTSVDQWAKNVGWYEASIGGEIYVFSKLYEALKAYDNHVLARAKGKKAKRNLPDTIIGASSNARSSSLTGQVENQVNYSSRYKGVSFDKSCRKYEAYIFSNNQMKCCLGRYLLAADGAWVVDQCSQQPGHHVEVLNFANDKEYLKARKNEMRERGVDCPRSEVQAYMDMNLSKGLAAVGNCLPKAKVHRYNGIQDAAAKIGHGRPKTESSSKCKYTHSSKSPRVQAQQALYKGVTFDKSNKRYKSYFSAPSASEKKNHYLGVYLLQNDAAWAIDECSRQLGFPAVNFANSSEYSKARRQEVEERGIDLPRSEVQEYIAEKVCVVVSAMGQEEVRSKPSQRTKYYSSQYTGVAFDKTNNKYIGRVTYKKKSRYLGRFLLGADAAWVHDLCARIANSNDILINFDSESDYQAARDKELAERGLDLSLNDVSLTFKMQLDKFRLVVGIGVDESWKKEEISAPYHDTEESVDFEFTSPVMNQISAFASSPAVEPDPATSNAIKTEHHPSNPITPVRSKLVMLNSEQTQNLRFPSGTPVWWFVGTDGDGIGMYSDGTVGSVYFEVTSRDLLYEVYCGNEPIFFAETDLGYAPHCPIVISRCFINDGSARDLLDQGGDLLQGSVLLCKRVGETWVYSASVRDEAGNMKLLEDIESNNVVYRKGTSHTWFQHIR